MADEQLAGLLYRVGAFGSQHIATRLGDDLGAVGARSQLGFSSRAAAVSLSCDSDQWCRPGDLGPW